MKLKVTPKSMQVTQEIKVQSLGWQDPREGSNNPTQYSCLENSVDRGVWRGQRSLVCYSPQGHKELDKTELT